MKVKNARWDVDSLADNDELESVLRDYGYGDKDVADQIMGNCQHHKEVKNYDEDDYNW